VIQDCLWEATKGSDNFFEVLIIKCEKYECQIIFRVHGISIRAGYRVVATKKLKYKENFNWKSRKKFEKGYMVLAHLQKENSGNDDTTR
jgi:RecA-family ATPase